MTPDDIRRASAPRARFLFEIVAAVRQVWPAQKPLFVRLSATDWVEGGWDGDQSALLSALLRQRGVDLVDVSTGGNVPADIPVYPPAIRCVLAPDPPAGSVADRCRRDDPHCAAGRGDPHRWDNVLASV